MTEQEIIDAPCSSIVMLEVELGEAPMSMSEVVIPDARFKHIVEVD